MKLAILFLGLVGSISCGFKDHAHRLYIGAGVDYPDPLVTEQIYNQIVADNFNCLTPGNEMKIDATEPAQNYFNFGNGDGLVSYANQHGMKVRGHTLVWHSQVPQWMFGLSGNALQAAMVNHINNVAGHYKGKLYAWDVCNEVLNEDGTLRDSLWSRAMNSSFIPLAFRTAHQADPNAKLYINDYNIEGINAKSNGLYNLVKSLLAQGVPIHGVGFQSHFTIGQIPSSFQANLKRFSDLGVDVAITELDIGNPNYNDQQQANDYASVITSCANVPRCVGVTIWGITDKNTWRGTDQRPCPWDVNYQPKACVNSITNALV